VSTSSPRFPFHAQSRSSNKRLETEKSPLTPMFRVGSKRMSLLQVRWSDTASFERLGVNKFLVGGYLESTEDPIGTRYAQ
jgi:hypothetical protein